jgi:hypothetical protein
MFYQSLFVATAAWMVALACPVVTAAALSTYRLEDGGERLFRYAGGLIGGSFDARLEGTFDIERGDDGASTIVRFDVYIADPLPLGPPSILGDPAGKHLSDYLIHDPVGLQVIQFPSARSPGLEPDVSNHPRTLISISDFDSRTALLDLYSGWGLLLDAPAGFIRDGGIAVELVPEPASMMVLATAFVTLAIFRRGTA